MEATCDICGQHDYNCAEVLDHLQCEGVKVLCWNCTEIVNRFAEKIHKIAEAEAKKAQNAMQARLDKLERMKRANKAFWFFANLRVIFKRQVIKGAFQVTKY